MKAWRRTRVEFGKRRDQLGHTREHALGERLIEMHDADAAIYAANSFHFERDGQCFLVMPHGISDALEARIRERDVHVVKVDVSEFYKKGGGSVKCMIGDLGEIV